MAEAFCNWLHPPLTELLGNTEFIKTLAPKIWATALGDLRHIRETTDEIAKQVKVTAQQLDHLTTLPRDTLELLASRFEIPTPHQLPDAELLDALTNKAVQYRSYRALIDGLDDRVASIANLKGAAQDAAERLDFQTVEELLARVDTVETEIAANTKQARAANALLQGRTQQAYTLLTAAADSFASVDPVEPSRRREAYGKMLHDYGMRFAGNGLELAARIWDKGAQDLDCKAQGDLWACLQNNLGTALATLGQRESGTARLLQAVDAFELALQELTQDRVPLDWAATQNNLGNALLALGERESGTARLPQAVEAYELALQEWTQGRVPLDWATAQNNLGNALLALGERESGTARLLQAVDAFELALQEWTQDRVPLQWATAQNNLGNALLALGERESDTARLRQAVDAYELALQEWTQDRVPLDWAMTQGNLGNALKALGQRESGTARLLQAVDAYELALQERTQDRVPLHWAMTQNNLGSVHLTFFDKTGDPAHLDRAETHMQAALEVFNIAAPRYAEMAQEQLQQIAQRRGISG
ncbi:hypothetical protein BAR1_09920 [Profundibacter amoris]|uniref:Tetratricopeptide repeat protein n=2 Tax=Profundibacter amoris TaxID=2171755 RepID=A0A347ULP7_9RHOB|nr:hypothetical protein BAR1_09920 [Profundibacter amoris]